MQRIVQQSASTSYSYFPAIPLLLPAPRIAGLLPARVGDRPSDAPTFIFANPRLVQLPAEKRNALHDVTQTLLDVAIAHMYGEMADHAINTALALFRQAVTGHAMCPRNPAQYCADADADLLDWLVGASRRMAIVREEIAGEIEALRQNPTATEVCHE